MKNLSFLWSEMADANQMHFLGESKYPRIRVTKAIIRYMGCSFMDASNFMQLYFTYLYFIKIHDEKQVKLFGKAMINEFNVMVGRVRVAK